jgi:hypothetical protein
MKAIFPLVHANRFSTSLVAAAAAIFLAPHAMAATTAVDLGSAANFAVLAGSGITFGGTVNSIPIHGDIGSSPTATITGLGNIVLFGTNQGGNAVAGLGKTDLSTAYGDAAGRVPDTLYGAAFDIGGLSLASGVYNSTSSFAITGNLTLDAMGDSNAVWIFQAGSTLITSSGSNVILTGGAKAENVFWQVGSSATLGTNSQFTGSVLALTSITVNTGTSVDGRLLASNGTVTMGASTSIIPEPSTSLLVGMGLLGLLVRRRRAEISTLIGSGVS